MTTKPGRKIFWLILGIFHIFLGLRTINNPVIFDGKYDHIFNISAYSYYVGFVMVAVGIGFLYVVFSPRNRR